MATLVEHTSNERLPRGTEPLARIVYFATRVAAWLMVGALWRVWLLPITRWVVRRLLHRLSFFPYLAGLGKRNEARFARHLIAEMRRKRQRGELSSRFLSQWVSALVVQSIVSPHRRSKAKARFDGTPQAFAILSPSMACNLRCAHCYAAAEPKRTTALDFEACDRVVTELEQAGTSLILLSGGEPLLWHEASFDLFALAARHPSLLFVVYTNGTLLDASVARRFRDAGNLLPLLSVEGFQHDTDAIRGTGTFARVRAAMEHLNRAGVLFGMSVTASTRNAAALSSPRFVREFIDEAGASFLWVLELAPLGRANEQWVLSPEKRDALQRALNQEQDDGRLIISFLHTEVSRTGCFGARTFDGFFYLDWERVVQRCVYQPEELLRVEHESLETREGARSLVGECMNLPECPLGRGGASSASEQGVR